MSCRAGGGLTAMAAIFAVGPTVTRADIPGLCAALAETLRGRGRGGGVVVCAVDGVTRPDVATVEALARLRLTARRHGRQLTVGGAGPELIRLIDLLGLTDLLDPPGPGESSNLGDSSDPSDPSGPGEPPGAGRLLLQAGRQLEQGEQAADVEEVVDGGDASR